MSMIEIVSRRPPLPRPLRGGPRAADRGGVQEHPPVRRADHPLPLERRVELDPVGRPRARHRPRERDLVSAPRASSLLYPGGQSETELLFPYGYCSFGVEGGASVGEPLRDARRRPRAPRASSAAARSGTARSRSPSARELAPPHALRARTATPSAAGAPNRKPRSAGRDEHERDDRRDVGQRLEELGRDGDAVTLQGERQRREAHRRSRRRAGRASAARTRRSRARSRSSRRRRVSPSTHCGVIERLNAAPPTPAKRAAGERVRVAVPRHADAHRVGRGRRLADRADVEARARR